MSWIEDRNITEHYVDELINRNDAKDFQIAFLLERLNQMLCAESEVVRVHVGLTLADHQSSLDLFNDRPV